MNSRRPLWLLAAFALLAVAACDSATSPAAPSVQDGFDAPGTKSFGQPILLLSSGVAVGDTLQPIVMTAASYGFPDVLARHLSRFRSSDSAVMVVNFDGTLTAKGTGSTWVTVNLDGVYDSTRVTVIGGWQPSITPLADYLVPFSMNDNGDILASGVGTTAFVHGSTETPITGCTPKAINNLQQVACDIPTTLCSGGRYGPNTPGIWRNGAITPVLPGAHGSVTGINDNGEVYGIIVDCPVDSLPPTYEYFIGKPGAIQRTPLPWAALAGPINNHGFGAMNATNGYIASATGRIPVRLGDTSIVVTVADINDQNDVVGSIVGGVALWSGANMPAISAGATAPWIGTTITSAPCNPTHISNQGEIFGYLYPAPWNGFCLLDSEGHYTDPAKMISRAAQPNWEIEVPTAQSRNGTLAAVAQNRATYQWGIAIVKP